MPAIAQKAKALGGKGVVLSYVDALKISGLDSKFIMKISENNIV